MIERNLGLSLVILGVFLILAGAIIYSIPKLEEVKIENPLIVYPFVRKDKFLIGFSPLIFLILLAMYLIFSLTR